WVGARDTVVVGQRHERRSDRLLPTFEFLSRIARRPYLSRPTSNFIGQRIRMKLAAKLILCRSLDDRYLVVKINRMLPLQIPMSNSSFHDPMSPHLFAVSVRERAGRTRHSNDRVLRLSCSSDEGSVKTSR